MTLWKNTDANTSAPKWALRQLGVAESANNINVLYGNVTSNAYFHKAKIGLFGVDTGEEQAIVANVGGPQHAGWVLRTEGQGGRAGRVTYETLVAMGSMTSDGEDSVFYDYHVTIVVQPQDSEEQRGNAVNFIVVADSVPSGATLTYQWQQDGGNAVTTWANVANSGVFASANGNTSATLSVSNNFTITGNTFRVLVQAASGDRVISGNAVISYV